MATKNDNTGLMSKMAKLIRGQSNDNPVARHSEQGQDSEFNRDALKERIERKRQDDIVRRREFNHLRQLRNTNPLLAGIVAGRPSVFQNSTGFNPEDRALTVKKIDDIEATMSKNWLERKPGGDSQQFKSTMSGATVSPVDIPVLTRAIPVIPLEATVTSKRAPPPPPPSPQMPLPLELTSPDEFDFTITRSAPTQTPTPTSDAVVTRVAPSPSVPPAVMQVEAPPEQTIVFRSSKRGGLDAGVSVFSSSKLGGIQVAGELASPDLQEAAIRFAEGDQAGAEEVLLAALKIVTTEPYLVKGYFAALFDLYRATGQQASFDVVAIDYAEMFGQSSPEWFSVPELLGRSNAVTVSDQTARPILSRQVVWECPATLDIKGFKALQATSAQSNDAPKHLNWAGLKKIEPDAAKELGELFVRWGQQAIELHFVGAEVLIAVLKSYTPSSDMRVDQMWWQLRLDALRVLHMRDDFESVALDFCVVYELSPPSWTDVLCECVHELIVDASGPASVLDSVYPESADMGLDGAGAALAELRGEVLGDAPAALEALETTHASAEMVVISCACLVRVDFSAAGSILNWTAARQARGSQVQFRDVPRLVAAFFTVIGIDEHASVVLRTR